MYHGLRQWGCSHGICCCGVKVFVFELRENASSAPLYSGRMMLLKRLGMLPCWKNAKNRWPHIWKSYLFTEKAGFVGTVLSTRSVLWTSNMPKIRWRPGLYPGPHWGSSRRSPRPPSRLGRGHPLPNPHSSRHLWRLASRVFGTLLRWPPNVKSWLRPCRSVNIHRTCTSYMCAVSNMLKTTRMCGRMYGVHRVGAHCAGAIIS